MSTPAATPKPSAKSTDTFFRFSRVETDTADDKEGTIQVAFSSETPVKRRAGKAEEALRADPRAPAFLIREHARKYQWSVALGTRWIRR